MSVVSLDCDHSEFMVPDGVFDVELRCQLLEQRPNGGMEAYLTPKSSSLGEKHLSRFNSEANGSLSLRGKSLSVTASNIWTSVSG